MDLIQMWYDDRYYSTLHFDTSVTFSLGHRSARKQNILCYLSHKILNRFEWSLIYYIMIRYKEWDLWPSGGQPLGSSLSRLLSSEGSGWWGEEGEGRGGGGGGGRRSEVADGRAMSQVYYIKTCCCDKPHTHFVLSIQYPRLRTLLLWFH